MTVHYHGGPIWGGDEIVKACYSNGGALVSFARPDQVKKIAALRCRLALDNGAFSTWKSSKSSSSIINWDDHWRDYYMFVWRWYHRIEWFIIPDVIEGTQEENDRQIARLPAFLREKAVPVWHSDESIERFIRLCEEFPRVAIGCCGPHRSIRSKAWRERMTEAFDAIYKERNLPVKVHGLRMLDGRALGVFPFDSADSTNVATNVPKDQKRFPEVKDKLHRTAILRASIEKVKPPAVFEYQFCDDMSDPWGVYTEQKHRLQREDLEALI